MIATDIRKECKSRRCGHEAGRPPPRSRAASGGWSLVELLVANAIGVSLALLALRAYLAGGGMQAEVTAALRLHEGARYAMHVFGQNARLAGFPGCLGETPEFSPLGPGWTGPMRFSAVEGWDAERPHQRLALAPDSDAVAFWWSVAGCGADGPAALRPPPPASAIQAGRGLRGSLFYIGRRGGSPNNPPALFMRDLASFDDSSPARELVEGVASMRVFYGGAGDGARLPAHQVRDWRDLRFVRIELQLRSLMVPDMRREFSRTVFLRNRSVELADFPAVEPGDAEHGP